MMRQPFEYLTELQCRSDAVIRASLARLDDHASFIVSPRTRRTQAVQHGGLRLIEIRQPQHDLAAGRFSVPLAHIGGLHTAGMHKLKQSSALSLDSESASAISHMPASSYNSAHDQRTLGPDRNHDSIPYRGEDAR